MEIIILSVVVLNGLGTLYMFKSLLDFTKSRSVELTVEEFEELEQPVYEPVVGQTIDSGCPDIITAPIALGDESRMAWRNVKEEQPTRVSPSPSKPLPKSGPLERPYGFVR